MDLLYHSTASSTILGSLVTREQCVAYIPMPKGRGITPRVINSAIRLSYRFAVHKYTWMGSSSSSAVFPAQPARKETLIASVSSSAAIHPHTLSFIKIIYMIAKYLIQLRQSKLCRKGCCQPPYDVTPLETAMPLGVKGRRSYPLLRLGSYKPMAFRPWVVDSVTPRVR